METTVKHTPLIATLAPICKASTLGKLILTEVTVLDSLTETISATPCIIPVNMLQPQS